MKKFISHKPSSIQENTFSLIGDEWMLVTAGDIKSFNTMTASWGGFGILWHKPVVFCFVRPQRYTYEFMERYDHFTLSFFDRKYHDALMYCGSKSGRDVDKIKATDLTPIESEKGCVYFEQAKLVIECRKIYYNDLDPDNFIDKKFLNEYPSKDYHRMYIGEVINCLREI